MFSTGPIWFLLLLEVFAAILPDIIIKVIENVRDTELIRKEKRDEQSRIERAKNNSKANLRLKNEYEIGNIEGFHSSLNGPNTADRDDNRAFFTPVIHKDIDPQRPSSMRKAKVHNSSISPSNNRLNSPIVVNNTKMTSPTEVKSKGQVSRKFSVEEIK